jgi:hypothetical protein
MSAADPVCRRIGVAPTAHSRRKTIAAVPRGRCAVNGLQKLGVRASMLGGKLSGQRDVRHACRPCWPPRLAIPRHNERVGLRIGVTPRSDASCDLHEGIGAAALVPATTDVSAGHFRFHDCATVRCIPATSARILHCRSSFGSAP